MSFIYGISRPITVTYEAIVEVQAGTSPQHSSQTSVICPQPFYPIISSHILPVIPYPVHLFSPRINKQLHDELVCFLPVGLSWKITFSMCTHCLMHQLNTAYSFILNTLNGYNHITVLF